VVHRLWEVRHQTGRRKAGQFFTKLDYEPLDLLAVNLGIYDQQPALDIVELVDQLGFDSISLGATLGYVMDYNRQHSDRPLLDGLAFGILPPPVASSNAPRPPRSRPSGGG
jgi:hypothetical protein